jgi:hypothetical protein
VRDCAPSPPPVQSSYQPAAFGRCQPNTTAIIRSAKHATAPTNAAQPGANPARRATTTTRFLFY